MAYNFNDHAQPTAVDDRESPSPQPTASQPGASLPAMSDVPEAAAFVRFRSCRWQQPKDDTNATEFCTHREVKPYAGTSGFDPNAWCTECQYYKLRRTPKKRSSEGYGD